MGYDEAALRGTRLLDLIDPDDAAGLAEAMSEGRGTGDEVPTVARCLRADGAPMWLEWRFLRDPSGDTYVTGHDVTERRRNADAIASLRLLEDEAERTAALGSWRLDLVDGGLTWSPEMYRLFGVDPSADLDLDEITRTAIHPDDRDAVAAINASVRMDGIPVPATYRIRRPDGTVLTVHAQGRQVIGDDGRAIALVGFVQDVTEQRDAAAHLRASEARYRSIIDGMQDAYFQAGQDGRLTLANQAAALMYGFKSPSEMIGIDARSLYADQGERDEVVAQLRRDGYVADRVGEGRRRDGSTFWVSLNVGLTWDENGAPNGTEGFARDVTDRVAAQQAREESLSLLRATLESTADGILVVDSAGDVASYNNRFIELWRIPADLLATKDDAPMLGWAADQVADPEGFVRNVARLYENPDEESFDTLELADGRVYERYSRPQLIGDGVVGRVWSFRDVTERASAERALRVSEEDLRDAQAIARIGSYVYDIGANAWTSSETMDDIFGIDERYVRDLDGWAGLVHESDRAMMVDYVTNDVVGRGLPFDKEYRVTRASDGHTVWVHGHGRLERDAQGRPKRLLGAIQDVTLRHRGEKALRETNESLERMVYEVAEAMGRVIEIRDQYTKGHQERTARLAKAIAEEMGMGRHDVTAVEMAAVVHDIGKLSVPAEILTRPTQLTELEMSLVREHPGNGYEILKDIPFPWPVADIVLQHHERMDGSGYPAGLSGDQIVPLARVLTVADVVEAMATHRPYRAALGLDAAIAELRDFPEKYDASTVDACLRLYERGEIEL